MPDPHLSFNRAHWHVVRAHHWQESRAEGNLRSGGIETLLPYVRLPSRRRAHRRDREPLFPQYLFARFDPVRLLHHVTFTRGVQSVIRVGGQLAVVDDAIVEFFRSCVDEHGLISLCSNLEPGERVRIEEGPFADLTGIVERNLPARQRVVVLLTSLACSVRVQVPIDHLRRCEVEWRELRDVAGGPLHGVRVIDPDPAATIHGSGKDESSRAATKALPITPRA